MPLTSDVEPTTTKHAQPAATPGEYANKEAVLLPVAFRHVFLRSLAGKILLIRNC